MEEGDVAKAIGSIHFLSLLLLHSPVWFLFVSSIVLPASLFIERVPNESRSRTSRTDPSTGEADWNFSLFFAHLRLGCWVEQVAAVDGKGTGTTIVRLFVYNHPLMMAASENAQSSSFRGFSLSLSLSRALTKQ